jgi:hypothetical protein
VDGRRNFQLTHGSATDTWWRPWCSDAGVGVLDHRSALDLTRGEAIYFDWRRRPRGRCSELARRRDLFQLPGERKAIGQNCVTPDGRWFVYIHVDRAAYDSLFEGDPDYAAIGIAAKEFATHTSLPSTWKRVSIARS